MRFRLLIPVLVAFHFEILMLRARQRGQPWMTLPALPC